MSQILVVEDDPLAQEIVSSILQSQGLSAAITSDGFSALRMLRETPYRVALVDYHLPEMDGYALAKLMRDISAGNDVQLHLVGMTADCHGLAARRGVDAIFDAIIAKPFDPKELIGMLERILRTNSKESGGTAADTLLANSDLDRARCAATTFWRARGLSGLPKVKTFPAPTEDQAGAIQICFDVVDQSSAELLLLLDARGLQELVRSRLDSTPSPLPIVTLDQSLISVSDAYFTVADPASWSEVAGLMKKRAIVGFS